MARNPQVLVVLSGGVIQHIAADSDVEIYVVNHDDIQEGQNPFMCLEPWPVENVPNLMPLLSQQLSEYKQIE